MKRKLLFLTLIGFLMLTACNNSKDAEESKDKITIKFAHYLAEDHPDHIALKEKFKKMVEENSNNEMEVKIYPNNQLGSEDEYFNSLKNGTIQMAIDGVIMQDEIPKLNLLQLPFLYDDYDGARKVFESSVGDEFFSEFKSKLGIHVLGVGNGGERVISSNKPIKSMKDLSKLKLRMPGIKVMVETGKALGVNTVSMPMSEVFTALDENVIDGQENPYSTLKSSGFYEAQKYVLETKHVINPEIFQINNNFWESLTDEQRKIIEDAIGETIDYQWELTQKQAEDDKEFIQNEGLEVIVPDEAFKKELIDATSSVYEYYYKEIPEAKELVEKIKEVQK